MSASRFEKAVEIVLQHEGGFVHHARDPGGATKFGITRETLSRVRGRPVTIEDVRELTRAEALAIYRWLYWDAVRVVGPVTLEAAWQAEPADTIRRLTRARLGFLGRLATWPVFGRGWRRRVLAVEQGALRLASSPPPHSRSV
ncbi:MAG: hypothetical protein K0Q60_4526 [Microvirga sp.]|nr:hypothetical protein [Microvirga sp.]